MAAHLSTMRLNVITASDGVYLDLYQTIPHGGEEYVRSARGITFEEAMFQLSNYIPNEVRLPTMGRTAPELVSMTD